MSDEKRAEILAAEAARSATDKYASRRGPRADTSKMGPSREKLDRWAHERHAQKLEIDRLAQLGRVYEVILAAQRIARDRHPCAGQLRPMLTDRGAHRFVCTCGAVVEVTDKEAAAR